MDAVQVHRAAPGDAGEILTVQRAAYVSEAQIYGDPELPPLCESLEEVRRAVAPPALGFVARAGGRLVGAVRVQVAGSVGVVGRLAVAPDVQGRGIASALLREVDRVCGEYVERLDLFTGHRSAANLRLYERMGYRETHRKEIAPHVTEVYLSKPIIGELSTTTASS